MKHCKRFFLLNIFFVFIAIKAIAVDIDVRIFTGSVLSSVTITPLSGKYVVYEQSSKVVDLYKNNPVTMKVADGKIVLTKGGEVLGSYTSLIFSAEGFLNTFTIKCDVPDIKARVYDDGIKVSVEDGHLKIINKVELEHYVAGVVESEGGIKKNLDFLKLQSIISRTYAISNVRKHVKEGDFNLCDKVHCQLYNGRCVNSLIMMATSQTSGVIIIDKSKKPISAAFYCNCGGQTCNSEDVWSLATPYLKSVKDTFCLSQKHATWSKYIQKDQWLKYLAEKFNYPVSDSLMVTKACNFIQKTRKTTLDDNPNIPLKDIRADWKFNSTLFNIVDEGDSLHFVGRGYGHAVGLCQEGAMKMVDYGWTYTQIINYYYKDVTILNISELK
jgi:stage II sporulation protein D